MPIVTASIQHSTEASGITQEQEILYLIMGKNDIKLPSVLEFRKLYSIYRQSIRINKFNKIAVYL